MAQARGGSQDVNPRFSRAQDIVDRVSVWPRGAGQSPTIGIADQAIIAAAGVLWAAVALPAGLTATYLGPQDKGRPRGWQANFFIRDAANVTVMNAHVSMLP